MKSKTNKDSRKNMKYKHIAILTLFISVLLLFSLSTISAANNTINDTSTGGISQGITDTGIGDTLFLQPGTYNKTSDRGITISKNMTIQGNGSTDTVIIDAQKLSRIFAIGNGYNVTFINITFINSNASSYSGAIGCQYSTSNFHVINCTFTNNSGPNGGAIDSRGSDFYVIDCIFNNNSATNGGAIYFSAGTVAEIYNSTFKNNKANTNGGAISVSSSNPIVRGCVFINNSAGNEGGAYSSSTSPNIIDNNTFINNSATSGGGMRFYGGTGNLTNNVFIGNTAINNGGAFLNSLANSNIDNNYFINNTANNGGTIYNSGNASVSGNTMNSNTASLGQMIYNAGNMGVLNLTFIDNSTWIVKNGSTITLYATLTDDMGNTVTGRNISFYLNGVLFENVTSIEGKANITYTVPSSSGDIPVSGVYAGNGNYNILINNGLLQVRIPTKITISVPKEVKVGDKVTLESKLTDENGNPITGKTVDFYVDGVKVGSGVTDSNGIARLNYTFNKAGKPNVDAKFAGDNTYMASNATNKTTVSKIPTDITITVPKEVNVGDPVTLVSKLTDEDGNPIVGKTVDFYVDGKKVGSAVTDENGIAKLNYTFTKLGKPNVVSKFAGDDKYLASNAAAQTKVSKIPTTLNIKVKGNKVIVTLTDKYGRVLAYKNIVVRIGDKVIYGGTDENGQFVFTFKNADKYTISATFAGTERYEGSSAKYIPESSNNSAATTAAMKNTGMPAIAILLVLLSTLGIAIGRKQK